MFLSGVVRKIGKKVKKMLEKILFEVLKNAFSVYFGIFR